MRQELADSYRSFYEHEYHAVVRYCWQLLRDQGAAEDVAQEDFLRLFSRWRRVEEPRAGSSPSRGRGRVARR